MIVKVLITYFFLHLTSSNLDKPASLTLSITEVDPTPGQKESASQDPFANNRAGEANPFASGNDATTADKTEAKVDKVERLINADEWGKLPASLILKPLFHHSCQSNV